MNIGLFNGDDLFLIDQDPLVNDHVCAFIDARILLIGHGRIVSAERSTIIDRVRAVPALSHSARNRAGLISPACGSSQSSLRADGISACATQVLDLQAFH